MLSMYDKEVVLDVLSQILEAVQLGLKRFEPVDSVDYFTDSPAGVEKLDAICMLLIAVGESLKNLDKITGKQLLAQYPEIDWKGAKGMRDIISHHYFDIDADEIYWVCANNLEDMATVLQKMLKDIQQS